MKLPELSTELRTGVPPLADGHIDITSGRFNTLAPDGKRPHYDRFHSEYPYELTNKNGTNKQTYQSDVERLVEGNVRIAFFNGFTQKFLEEGAPDITEERGANEFYGGYAPGEFRKLFETHDNYYRFLLRKRRDVLQLVTNKSSFAAAQNEGKIAVIRANEGIEGATLEDLDHMLKRGVRSFGKWNDFRPDHPYEIGSPARLSGTPRDTGLTPWGKEAVRYLTSNGAFWDISHSGDQSAIDAIETAVDRPAGASHSFFRTEDPSTEHMGTASKRNSPLYIIDALAANDGFMGIPGAKGFSRDWNTIINFIKFMADAGRLHMLEIGSDFDGMAPSSHIPGFDNSATLSTVLSFNMRQAGFNNKEVYDVSYGNMHRRLSKYLQAA